MHLSVGGEEWLTCSSRRMEGLELSNRAVSEKTPQIFTPSSCARLYVLFVERINFRVWAWTDRQTKQLLYPRCACTPRVTTPSTELEELIEVEGEELLHDSMLRNAQGVQGVGG